MLLCALYLSLGIASAHAVADAHPDCSRDDLGIKPAAAWVLAIARDDRKTRSRSYSRL